MRRTKRSRKTSEKAAFPEGCVLSDGATVMVWLVARGLICALALLLPLPLAAQVVPDFSNVHIGAFDADAWNGIVFESMTDGQRLHYVAGSHRWPDLPITGLVGDMTAINAVLSEEQRREFQCPVAIQMKKGEASFHHPRMVHGSFANIRTVRAVRP